VEEKSSLETLVHSYQTKRRHIPNIPSQIFFTSPDDENSSRVRVGEFLCGYDDRNELYIHLHLAQRLKCDIPLCV